MSPAEFEEKDYEGPLYVQLLCGSHRISTPGQVFENAFGVDAALEAHHAIFWDYFGYNNIPAGIRLTDYSWGWVHRKHDKDIRISGFPVNLLIQSKRPDVMVGPSSRLLGYGIKKGYWRFSIKDHQQSLLNKLSRRLKHRALVVYAAPAFDTWLDLDGYMETQELVENSTFVQVERMNKHHSWNYDQPGTAGVASSEPERVSDVSFYENLEERVAESEESNPNEDLTLLINAIEEAVGTEPDNPVTAAYKRRIEKLARLELQREVLNFTKIRSFFILVNVTWLVGHR